MARSSSMTRILRPVPSSLLTIVMVSFSENEAMRIAYRAELLSARFRVRYTARAGNVGECAQFPVSSLGAARRAVDSAGRYRSDCGDCCGVDSSAESPLRLAGGAIRLGLRRNALARRRESLRRKAPAHRRGGGV